MFLIRRLSRYYHAFEIVLTNNPNTNRLVIDGGRSKSCENGKNFILSCSQLSIRVDQTHYRVSTRETTTCKSICRLIRLFPLNRCRRIGRDVVNDSIYTFDFIDNAIRHAAQDVVGHMIPICRHVI